MIFLVQEAQNPNWTEVATILIAILTFIVTVLLQFYFYFRNKNKNQKKDIESFNHNLIETFRTSHNELMINMQFQIDILTRNDILEKQIKLINITSKDHNFNDSNEKENLKLLKELTIIQTNIFDYSLKAIVKTFNSKKNALDNYFIKNKIKNKMFFSEQKIYWEQSKISCNKCFVELDFESLINHVVEDVIDFNNYFLNVEFSENIFLKFIDKIDEIQKKNW
ncbi:hypothetical protein [Mesoplasma florum]|uniref:hypothetical protein n=1 Tax=Mesoplasma florum TaxID=2151 RepID=UPI000BE29FF9|nr:hypothetical protein [Mesoplasma florum]ATI73392.1 hypothetical protein CQZ69_02360 [Mesoplasma florum]AVN61790.1 hypothetical protein CG004_02360 [Mesoplasma florum]